MKLYLRTTLAVFAALMVAFSVMMVLKTQFVDPKWRNDLAKLTEPKFEFMKEMFDALPPAERFERLRQIR